eukprot:gene30449-36798_t
MRNFVCSDPISKVVYGSRVLLEKGLAELENIQATRIVLVCTSDVKIVAHYNQFIKMLGDLVVEIFDHCTSTSTDMAANAEALRTRVQATRADCVFAMGGSDATEVLKIACAPNTINSSEMTSLVRNYNACVAPKPQYTIINHVTRCALIFYDLEIYKNISQDNLVKGAFLMLAHITDMFFNTKLLQHTHTVDPNYIPELVYAIYLCGECWKREGTHLHHYLVDYLHHEYGIAYDDLHLALHAYTAWCNQSQVMLELVEELGSFDLAGLVYDLQYALLPSRVSLLLLGITPAALPNLLNTVLNKAAGLVCNPVPITAETVSSAVAMACAGGRPTSSVVPKPPFSSITSMALVLDRFQTCPSPRLKLLLMRAVQAIHSSVKSAQLPVDEFEGLVGYLTRVGQRCVERQEMMMLFDVLGVEALVEDMQFRNAVSKVEHDLEGVGEQNIQGAAQKGLQTGILNPTPGSLLGPFHVANSPFLPNGAALFDQKQREEEEVYVFRGRVMDTHGALISEAVLDIWHSDDDGYYDVQPEFHRDRSHLGFRCKLMTDEHGCWSFKTLPVKSYTLPQDGPVGELVRAVRQHSNLPAHVHFIVAAKGCVPLITHLYPRSDDPYLQDDSGFCHKPELIKKATPLFENVGGGSELLIEQDFVLVRDSVYDTLDPRCYVPAGSSGLFTVVSRPRSMP